jgi:hypothetical protein
VIKEIKEKGEIHWQQEWNVSAKGETTKSFLISDFRHVLNIVYVLLGISPASDCGLPIFWNPLSVPSSKAGCRV